jgi:acetolactate synthase-1/3 small subunit
MKHVLSVLVNNSAGVLSHVSGLFTRRGYNIDSLSVGETEDPTKSTITIVVNEEEKMVRQIEMQLYKLMNVLRIEDLTYKESAKRELVLVTVTAPRESRSEILTLIDVFKARIVDMTKDQIMVEMSGTPRAVESFLEAFREIGIEKIARTGTIALALPSCSYCDGNTQ